MESLRCGEHTEYLRCGRDRCNELAVKVYGICSKDSNAMKSENPKSGFYEAETSRCLDANGGNPTCNQGAWPWWPCRVP